MFGTYSTLDNRCGIIFPSTEKLTNTVQRPVAMAGFGPIPSMVEFWSR